MKQESEPDRCPAMKLRGECLSIELMKCVFLLLKFVNVNLGAIEPTFESQRETALAATSGSRQMSRLHISSKYI
jgi:hypothetical protein